MHFSFALVTALLSVVTAMPLEAETATLAKRVTHSGPATFYFQNGAFGSCGEKHPDSDFIIALSPSWGSNAFCGRKIQITNTGGGQQNNGVGRTIIATVKDTCPGCDQNHLDLSTGAFKQLTGGNLDPPGQINIDWHFCNVNGQC